MTPNPGWVMKKRIAMFWRYNTMGRRDVREAVGKLGNFLKLARDTGLSSVPAVLPMG